ncbi:MAG: hypothetical protein GKS06_13665 [Acidobacteria bacterium]|nr:hypothetical protein [Acidobacteriota bacterium]
MSPTRITSVFKKRFTATAIIALTVLTSVVTAAPNDDAGWTFEPLSGDETLLVRDALLEMKERDRGPFERLRWFCADGTILPPRPYACREHGGGLQ